ncbi:hypothetical protein N9N28_05370 [Rubripirellula amarantea]|uniref:Uncharacterized protein n=1 Tax=Rubripirellula amarantea TaxID=2527999 RepID=A0A5C5WWC1_9BACT|nr:DUF6580 family putative transport protein [Rubripirellula amarantea]MDA8744043.1 hypothetical protein [Rubripirellula amarantea]TWT54283.1 hypothetical protein Pla22_19250 [Rubripirellula amarantea]
MFYVALILVAVASRFLPHPPNVACIGAIGLFVGCYAAGKRAYLVPAAVLLLSDIIGYALGIPGMGFYAPVTMLAVYGGATLAVLIGRQLAKVRASTTATKFGLGVFGGSLAASTLFFIVSNLGVWAAGWYSMTAGGLVSCFVAAIPFYGYTIAGDLAFSALMFAGYEFAMKPSAVAAKA